MKILLKTLMFVVLSCLILVACQSPNRGSINQKYQEKDILFISSNTIQLVSSLPPGYIHNLKWVDDNTLYIKIDQTQWAINIPTLSTNSVENEDPTQPTISEVSNVAEYLEGMLQENEEIISSSPSGKIHIFINKYINENIPINGEAPQNLQTTPIGLIRNNQKLYLGNVTSCGNETIIWYKNDNFVFENNCIFGKAWVYSNILNRLNIVNESASFTTIHTISPNEEYLLCDIEGSEKGLRFRHPCIVKFSDLSVTRLNNATYAIPIGWLNETKILVLYNNNSNDISAFFKLGVYNVAQNTIKDLLDLASQEAIANTHIRWVSISEKKTYFAFTIDVQPYKQSQLWIGSFKNRQ